MRGVFSRMTVCYSLQMKKSTVEVMISLVVLCGGNCDNSLLYLWVFCWRVSLCLALFSSYSLVIVTTPSCNWCYGVDVYVSNHLLVIIYIFHLVMGLFCGIGINTVGYRVAIMPRSMI
jgi:hypothetical protein